MQQSIKGLRQSGYKVRVLHYRSMGFSTVYKTQPLKLIPNLIVTTKQVTIALPKGGRTVVELRTPCGLEVSGEATCRKNEVYSKKIGVAIALKRALDKVNGNIF